jgi:hypothetical protein
MAASLAGLMLGVFVGLAVRPLLDAWVVWRYARAWDIEPARSPLDAPIPEPRIIAELLDDQPVRSDDTWTSRG